jgi:hypothetical protein
MTTRVDQAVVDAQVKDYETTRDNLAQNLETARQEAKNLASTSSSGATQALDQIIDEWVNSTKRTLLDEDMTDIANLVRHAKDDQMNADDANAKQVLNLQESSAAFLS